MTIEMALLVAGGVLIFTLLWLMSRIELMSRPLTEIQGDVNALRDLVSRVFLAQLNHKEVDQSQVRTINGSGRSRIKQSDPPDEPSDPTPPPPSDPIVKNDRRQNDVLKQGEMEFEAVEINELCAKLITLVPPKEAAPLLLPERAPPGARERRLLPRHQTSKVGKIVLQGSSGDTCTVSNMSPAGALLLVANAYGLAEQFDLHMDGYIRRCIARWR